MLSSTAPANKRRGARSVGAGDGLLHAPNPNCNAIRALCAGWTGHGVGSPLAPHSAPREGGPPSHAKHLFGKIGMRLGVR